MEIFDIKELKNTYCTVALLSYDHCDALNKAASDGELWNLHYATIPKPNVMQAEIKRRLDLKKEGLMLPFSVIHNATQHIVGMTTYCNINLLEKRLDIGWTWYAKQHQRTALNTNCKLLLLENAIENMNFEKIYFKVHTKNTRSQSAVLRLGAKFFEVIKNYRTTPGNKPQSYNHYYISKADWPEIKQNLLSRIYPAN